MTKSHSRSMESRQIITPEQAQEFAQFAQGLPLPVTITWTSGKGRSLSQNALFHKWMHEIAEQSGDVDAHDMKGICHREFGLPIRLRNTQFAWVWEQTGARMTYEQQCNLLASGVLNISSGMTTGELKEYLDTVQRHFLLKGYDLTDPEKTAGRG